MSKPLITKEDIRRILDKAEVGTAAVSLGLYGLGTALAPIPGADVATPFLFAAGKASDVIGAGVDIGQAALDFSDDEYANAAGNVTEALLATLLSKSLVRGTKYLKNTKVAKETQKLVDARMAKDVKKKVDVLLRKGVSEAQALKIVAQNIANAVERGQDVRDVIGREEEKKKKRDKIGQHVINAGSAAEDVNDIITYEPVWNGITETFELPEVTIYPQYKKGGYFKYYRKHGI